MRYWQRAAIHLSFLLLIFLHTEGWAAVPVLAVRHWSHAGHSRIVIDVGGPVSYKERLSEDSLTITVEIYGASPAKRAKVYSVRDRFIRKIAVSPQGKENSEIVISPAQPAESKIFTLPSAKGKPHRLIADVCRSTAFPLVKGSFPKFPVPRKLPNQVKRQKSEKKGSKITVKLPIKRWMKMRQV